MRALLGSLIGLSLLTGCGTTDNTSFLATPTGSVFPSAPTHPGSAEIGVRYRYTLITHCGLNSLPMEFDGSEWLIDGPTGFPNAPDGFGNPSDQGTIVLDSHEAGTYRSSGGVDRRITRIDPLGPQPSYVANCA